MGKYCTAFGINSRNTSNLSGNSLFFPSLQYSSSLVSNFSAATIASDGQEFKSLSLYDCLHLFVEYRHC